MPPAMDATERLGKQGLRSLERRERFITELGIEVG